MKILVDADAFPRAARDILLRASKKRRIPVVFVANRYVRLPGDALLSCVVAPEGPDEADDRIVELTEAVDLVVTADIPLADRVVSKGARAVDPRGQLYTADNVKERLASRDLMADLRDAGEVAGGPAGYAQRDAESFANTLNAILSAAQAQT